jgi:hypothetical protein
VWAQAIVRYGTDKNTVGPAPVPPFRKALISAVRWSGPGSQLHAAHLITLQTWRSPVVRRPLRRRGATDWARGSTGSLCPPRGARCGSLAAGSNAPEPPAIA